MHIGAASVAGMGGAHEYGTMQGPRYSYLDLTVLPALRRRVLANEAAILFSHDMRHVLWANSAGATLFGGAGLADLIESPLNPAQPFVHQLRDAAAQIEDGEPLVRGFRVARGLRTELIQCELSRLRLPGGDDGVLLICTEDRLARPMREHELAEAAVGSLADFATAAAVIDEYGLAIAATDSFAEIDMSRDDLGDLVDEASDNPDRLVKRVRESVDGRLYAVGVARLRDRPGRYLLVCAETDVAAGEDEAGTVAEMPEEAAEPAAMAVEPIPAAARIEPSAAAKRDATAPAAAAPEKGGTSAEERRAAASSPVAAPAASERTPSLLDRWYFGVTEEIDREDRESPQDIAATAREEASAGAVAAEAATPPQPAGTSDEGRAAPPMPAAREATTAEDTDIGHGKTEELPDEEESEFVFPQGADPVRFAWIIDDDQVFRSVSPELARTVGPNAADIVGRRWSEVANVFGFDRSGEIRRLLEKRDTWSGKSVLWPVQGTDLAVPIDLAALPSFSAARQFDGFRGFGIIRTSDAIIDPNETGLALAGGKARGSRAPKEPSAEAAEAGDAAIEERRIAKADGPGAEARETTNVVDLASRKRAEAREELSRRESQAFSEIGRTLRGSDAAGEPADAPEASGPIAAEPEDEAAGSEFQSQGETIAGDRSSRAGQATASILGQLPVPVLVYRNGETLFANRELLELTGYASAAEIDAAGGVAGLLSGETENEEQATLTLKDGRSLQISPLLKSVPWENGKALLLSFRPCARQSGGIVLPPDEKIALDMARVAELQNILDTATDGIIITGTDGTVESLNASAEALFGINHGEATGRPVTELFAQESHKTLNDYMAELAQPGVASILNDGREVIGKEAKGGLIPLFVTIGRIGAAEKFCAVIRDMTQWKKAEEELVNARRAAELASEQKTDFLARVSHEIRTPLNAIIGFSDVMLEERFGPLGNDRYREYLRDINRSGVHVLDLINDLLDISKIEAGKMELTYEAVDLNQLVAETVALLQPQANRDRIIIRTSLSRAVPRVVADARSIRQIILNLVSNAIKFTPENGQVIVSTVYEGNGEVALRVRDTGRGMSEQEIENAMKPFHQLRSADSRRGQGTGLGLPLTKALVEANRAYFDLESSPGEGTIAHVHFPIQRVLAD